MKLTLFRQRTTSTCGAAAFRTILSRRFSMSEKEAVDLIGTTKHGTHPSGLLRGFANKGIWNCSAHVDFRWAEYSDILKLNLSKFDMILGVINKVGRKKFPHWIVAHAGYILDPAHPEPITIDEYPHYWGQTATIIDYLIFVPAQ